ncbi:MAG: DUF2059 domain-containing protein [Pseudomonadales bacterium]|nr:DUF2059 domain-containing protein [Pseudomonadales bacterium]
MIQKIATLMFFVLPFTFSIYAEELGTDAAKLAAIKELLASTGAPANSQQFTRAFSQQLISVLRIANPQLSQQAIDIVNEEVDKIVSKAFANDALQREIYPLYAKYFTLDELEALVVFNRSKVGKKANAIMPQLMQESLVAAELWSQEIGPLISTEVLRRFEEEGISIRMSPESATK